MRITDPITKNYSVTDFYQGRPGEDGALKGQIKEITSYDGNGKIISHTVNTYDVKKGGSSDSNQFLGFPALVTQTTTAYEENGQWLSTTDTSAYDDIGNVILQTNVASSSDVHDQVGQMKKSTTAYAPAYTGFNRPLEAQLKDQNDTIITRKSFAYDARGNLSRDTVYIINPLAHTCHIHLTPTPTTPTATCSPPPMLSAKALPPNTRMCTMHSLKKLPIAYSSPCNMNMTRVLAR